jgi:iron uptake system EfeUOB component EfeO/EfeM
VDTSVRNVGNAVLRVDLVEAGSSDVFATLTALAPGTSRQLRISLPDGSFRLECTSGPSTGPTRSPVHQVTSSKATRGQPLKVVSTAEAQSAGRALAMRLSLALPALSRELTTLDAAVRRGDLAAARLVWLQAHSHYVRIGGTGGAFGTSAAAIDGLPSASSGGVRGSDFTGFHLVEQLLWNGGTRVQLQAAITRLSRDVATLATTLRAGAGQPRELILAPRRILETAARSTLTGDDDFGSHSGLATLAADVTGARQLMQVLDPLLQKRNRDLAARVEEGLTALAEQLAQVRLPDGRYPTLQSLDARRRERLDGAVDGLLELVAQVPTTLQLPQVADPD